MSGSSCATTGSRTGSSPPTRPSSITAVRRGTSSPTSPGASCPSVSVTGLTGSDHWDLVLEIAPGATLIRLGGHFAGGTVLHWADTEDGAGALLSGDIVQVAGDVRRVSFLW